MPLMDVKDAAIDYSLDGPEGAPIIVLSHSLATSREMWLPQMAALAGRFRVLRYDLRGHGASPVSSQPNAGLADYANDAARLLTGLGITQAIFVGLSLGGMIGQRMAMDHPGLISKLVLCCTSSQTPDTAQPIWDDRIRAAREEGMESQVAPTINRWFTQGFQRGNPEAADQIRTLIRATPVQGFIAACQAIKALDNTDWLYRIKAPTLVIAGELDPGTPPATNKVIADAIPGARMEIIPGAMHLANVEQADAFNRILLDFI